MDTAEQLRQVLEQLPMRQALALARKVERQRALGQEQLPSELILSALRPRLVAIRPPRVPTLCRLVAMGFEDFLTDRIDEPRLPGILPRQAVPLWWRAITHIAGHELTPFETRLTAIVDGENEVEWRLLGEEARNAAAEWTAALLSALKKPKPDPALKLLIPTSNLPDLQLIARILAMAAPLRAALDATTEAVRLTRNLDGKRITDLPAEVITILKQQYMLLSETQGLNARFFAFAVLNRLEQPCHILRLGRALSWKPNDTLVASTEFGAVGERLILDLQRLSREIIAQVGHRGIKPEPNRLGLAIAHYLEDAEGLLGELGFRRDSPWGEAILKTRMNLAEAMDRDFLDRFADMVLDCLPLNRKTGKPDIFMAPSPAIVDLALEAARFLRLLVLRGQRHGIAQAARDTVEALGGEIDSRVNELLDELRRNPDLLSIEAQIDAIAQAAEAMFEDGRGPLILRRMRNAQRTLA